MASELTIIIANFSTTLAAKVTAGDVAGTLASATDKEGNALPTGVYGFTINEGKSNEQHIKCLLTGTAMTVVKGITHAGVESTGFLKTADINSPVKITDFVSIRRIVEILDGTKALNSASPMFYDAEFSVTDRKQVVTAGYAQDLLSGAVGTASDSNSGTNKVTKAQGSKPKAVSVLVREQATPDKTLLVESFNLSEIDRIVAYTGGNTPNFIDPGFGGDLAFNTNPSNSETVVITVDGTPVTITFVTSIGATPGNILIGGSAAVTRANFVNFINNPTVTNANQVAVTGASLTAIQKLSSTDDASLNAFIRVINTSTTAFSVVENLAGAGNTWTANTTKNRYDLIVVDGSNTLQIRKGTEAVSPTVPTPTTGDIVLALVLNRCGQTTVRDYNVSGQGYITQWYTPSVYRTDIATTATVATVKKFGGTGADGALTVSSGTTTLDLAGARYFVKNYSSISITGTGQIAFSNPHANGTIIVFLCQGDFVCTSSATPAIDASGMGAAGGAQVTAAGNGNAGTPSISSQEITQTSSGGTAGNTSGGSGSGSQFPSSTLITRSVTPFYFKNGIVMCPGSGGGGGSVATGQTGTGAAGGRGGGALYIEIGGNINFTGQISVAGKNGSVGAGPGGSGGGGGSAGNCVILYNGTAIAVSGTINSSGGNGDTSVNSGFGNSGGGGAGSSSAAGGTQAGGSTNGGNGSLGSGGGGTCNFGGTARTGGTGGGNETNIVAKNNYFA